MRRFFALILVGIILLTSHLAQAEVKIFACEPEWEALAKEIGGKNVKTFSATHAKQDPHHIRARPSFLSKARNANIIFCSGADLEIGWLPILLQKASSSVQPGEIGYLMAADYVPILEKLSQVDRSMGDVHPKGNAHVHLNPHNILLVAKELTRRLKIIDEPNNNFYQAQLDNFLSRWGTAISNWEKNDFSAKKLKLVVHHKSFSYLFDWLNIKAVASLEPKPGIAPTTKYLQSLLINLKHKPANLIVRTPYEPSDASEWLSDKLKIRAIVLPYTINGDKESDNLFTLFDRTVSLLQEVNYD